MQLICHSCTCCVNTSCALFSLIFEQVLERCVCCVPQLDISNLQFQDALHQNEQKFKRMVLHPSIPIQTYVALASSIWATPPGVRHVGRWLRFSHAYERHLFL